jgi:hypothetical protein
MFAGADVTDFRSIMLIHKTHCSESEKLSSGSSRCIWLLGGKVIRVFCRALQISSCNISQDPHSLGEFLLLTCHILFMSSLTSITTSSGTRTVIT